jgi:hypothetical protein
MIVERERAVHVAVVGYGDRPHPQFLRALRKRLYLYRAVEKTVVGMKMEVNKVFFVHCLFLIRKVAMSSP